MATISDIARQANVSRTLVSRVLNNKPGVSPENRKRILEVIEENHYVPNGLAKSLVLQRTNTIGVIMDDLCNDFFFKLIAGLQDAAEAQDYNILFCSGRKDTATRLKYVDYLTGGCTDGIIAYGSRFDDENLFRYVAEKSANSVLIESNLNDCVTDKILLDNFHGAYIATEHLIKQGRKNIVHVTCDMNYDVGLERLNGFVQAMHDYRMPLGPDSILYADHFENIAYQQMKNRLSQGTRPDACFTGADKPAFGVLRAAMEAGLSIPGDLAVIGFDDDVPDSKNILFPPLSTMRQPLYEMGQAGVTLLIDKIKQPDREPVVKTFEAELVLRETCR
ncbi:MAG: LacI family transcriptional regulator [Lachnospiraceae bacterium]|nr:LacI family transcriptional regulator [Lachnospiraceae bacterium]